MESLLNETLVSEKIQVSLACLRRWRLRGEGPQYLKVGPLLRYRPEAITEWIEALHGTHQISRHESEICCHASVPRFTARGHPFP